MFLFIDELSVVILGNSDDPVMEGDDLTLTCYTSDSSAKYTWTFISQQTTQQQQQNIISFTGNHVFISSTDFSHQGTYTCTAQTSLASGTDSVIVIIKTTTHNHHQNVTSHQSTGKYYITHDSTGKYYITHDSTCKYYITHDSTGKYYITHDDSTGKYYTTHDSTGKYYNKMMSGKNV